jgi:hypothetical protein
LALLYLPPLAASLYLPLRGVALSAASLYLPPCVFCRPSALMYLPPLCLALSAASLYVQPLGLALSAAPLPPFAGEKGLSSHSTACFQVASRLQWIGVTWQI